MGQGGREELAELAVGRRKGTRSLRIALLITVLFMLVEFVGGLWTNSLALLADAGHMLTDAAALSLSLFAVGFILRQPLPKNLWLLQGGDLNCPDQRVGFVGDCLFYPLRSLPAFPAAGGDKKSGRCW